MRAAGLEPTRPSRIGGFKDRCGCQFRHTRKNLHLVALESFTPWRLLFGVLVFFPHAWGQFCSMPAPTKKSSSINFLVFVLPLQFTLITRTCFGSIPSVLSCFDS